MKARSGWISQFIDTLSKKTEIGCMGVQRLSYTTAYREGVNYVSQVMRDEGLQVYEDPIGNLFGFLQGEDPSCPMILSGSHLDTVQCGGAYDGAAGVACALEAAHMIIESGVPLRHTFGVLGTIEEEGSRFGQALLGSRFLTGAFEEEQVNELLEKEDGRTMNAVIREYGLQGMLKNRMLVDKGRVRAFLEIHGEQGPVLEKKKIQAGIVEMIAGIRWLEVIVIGETGHSGTIPMGERKDAGIGAFRILLYLNREITKRYSGDAVVTAGRLCLEPGSINCVPGKCSFTLDIRSGKKEILKEITELVQTMRGMVQDMGMDMRVKELSSRDPVPMDSLLQKYFAKSCEMAEVSYMKMNSGAGHDSMVFAQRVPAGMLFLPNRGGVSHCPEEYISGKDLEKGAEVLYGVIRMLDREERRI